MESDVEDPGPVTRDCAEHASADQRKPVVGYAEDGTVDQALVEGAILSVPSVPRSSKGVVCRREAASVTIPPFATVQLRGQRDLA